MIVFTSKIKIHMNIYIRTIEIGKGRFNLSKNLLTRQQTYPVRSYLIGKWEESILMSLLPMMIIHPMLARV